MRRFLGGFFVLTAVAMCSCKKERQPPPIPSTLQELHFRIYDSTNSKRVGHLPDAVITNITTALNRIDTVWRDSTVDTPFIIYRSDTLKIAPTAGSPGSEKSYKGWNLKHLWGPYVEIAIQGDSFNCYLVQDDAINHATHYVTHGVKVP